MKTVTAPSIVAELLNAHRLPTVPNASSFRPFCFYLIIPRFAVALSSWVPICWSHSRISFVLHPMFSQEKPYAKTSNEGVAWQPSSSQCPDSPRSDGFAEKFGQIREALFESISRWDPLQRLCRWRNAFREMMSSRMQDVRGNVLRQAHEQNVTLSCASANSSGHKVFRHNIYQ